MYALLENNVVVFSTNRMVDAFVLDSIAMVFYYRFFFGVAVQLPVLLYQRKEIL